MTFAGGQPDVMVFTSSCGIPGVDTILLHGIGPEIIGEFEVTFSTYDAANARWTGRLTGQTVAANGTVGHDDAGVTLFYDFGTGEWLLDGSWAERVPGAVC
jgi:hypothetical protein